jgi:hypothetical protein
MGAKAAERFWGAGSDDFLAFLVAPERHKEVAKSLSGLLSVDFGINAVGSKTVVYEPQGLSERYSKLLICEFCDNRCYIRRPLKPHLYGGAQCLRPPPQHQSSS